MPPNNQNKRLNQSVMVILDWLRVSRMRTATAHLIPLWVYVLVISQVAIALKSPLARAQAKGDPYAACVSQMNRVAGLWQYVNVAYAEHEPIEPDSLRLVVRAAKASRQCFRGAYPDRRIWLLHRESWSLDELGRYREAGDLVELFFRDLAGEASPFYLARFSLRRVRYRSFSGELSATLDALEAARALIGELTVSEQVNARLTAASLLIDGDRPEAAADTIKHVMAEIERLESEGEDDLRFALARARHLREGARRVIALAEAPPTAPEAWRTIAESLEQVAGAYRALAMPRRASAVLADLGEAYARLGEMTTSDARLEEALQEAGGDPKSLLYLHLRRGRVRVRRRQHVLAEADFQRGLVLADSSGVHTHTFDLLFERARLDEGRRRLARARRRYRLIAERPTPFAPGAIRAASIKGSTEERIRSVEHALVVRERGLLRIGIVLVLVLAALGMVVAATSRRQRTAEADLAIRLAGKIALVYMKEITADTKAAARIIKKADRHLARRLSRDKLRGKMELYACLAHLMNEIEGARLNAHSARMRLHRLFKAKDWPWPEGEDPLKAWRRFFEGRDVD